MKILPSPLQRGETENAMKNQMLISFLAVGTAVMFVPIILLAKKNKMKYWKLCIITVLLTLVGTVGTKLMYYVENHTFVGLSFYGAVS